MAHTGKLLQKPHTTIPQLAQFCAGRERLNSVSQRMHVRDRSRGIAVTREKVATGYSTLNSAPDVSWDGVCVWENILRERQDVRNIS